MDDIVINLKQELDRIDADCLEYASNRYFNSRLRLIIGMWEKGEIISNYRGGKFTYYELEKETNRPHQSLKKWHELYKINSDKDLYIKEIATPQAQIWTQKALIEGKEKQTIVQLFTGNNEWYTPGEYIELARKTMGKIDLDPASSDVAQKTIKATKYFTIDDNGLNQEWKGNIWLNPPYSGKEIIEFVDKLIGEYEIKNVKQAVVLTNDNTDTSWFHKLVKISSAICLLNGRIKFYNDNEVSAPTNGQTFFYLGNNLGNFKREFKNIGIIMTKYD